MNDKIVVSTEKQVDEFVDLLARSKAVWMSPELLNLVATVSSPSSAYELVLQKTGSRRKAKAGRWLAIAVRDYYPLWPQSCIRMLKHKFNLRPELLKRHLKSTLALDESDEHKRKITPVKTYTISQNPSEVFQTVQPEHVSDRVSWLKAMRDAFPENKNHLLAWAFENEPGKVEEIIRTTSLTPMVFLYNGGTFDHELENFVFFFTAAGIHKYPRLVKVLWDKVLNESPEPIIEPEIGFRFLVNFVQEHPKHGELLKFIMTDLFDRVVPGRIDPKDVIPMIRIINGLYPKVIYDEIAKFKDGQEIMRGIGIYTIRKSDYEEGLRIVLERKYPEDGLRKAYLSVDESRRMIDKINELFFS